MLNITTQLVTVPVTVSGVTVIVSAAVPGGGGGGATTWGSITGTLASQGDLNDALNDRLLASAVSAFGLTLIDDADAAAARTTMGLGTAATQATSAFEAAGAITTHAGVTSSVHGITAYGSSIVSSVDAAAARTALGLGGAAVLSVGTTGGTVAAGDDARLSDARTPTSHTHGNISNSGSIGVTANLPIITSTLGSLTTGSFGTTANTFCQGNDARLSDARTPTAHTHGNITNVGAIGSTSGVPIITGASGVLQAGSFGTTAGTYCQGDDARLAAQTITLTGDVTGSGTGSFAATIANDAVTYAKMQNVSATDRLLGRSTAGAGDVEEITCTAAGRALLDDADTQAQRTTLGVPTVYSGTSPPSGGTGVDGDLFFEHL